MKSLKVTNLGAIRNERNRCKKGKKFGSEPFFGEEPSGEACESDPAAGPPPDPSSGD